MNFYVASKFENKDRVSQIITQLRNAGHDVPFSWVNAKDDSLSEAMYDIRAVRNCDALVGVFEKKLEYKGAIAELGMAIAYKKHIFILGDQLDKMIFMRLPNVLKIRSVQDIIEWYTNY